MRTLLFAAALFAPIAAFAESETPTPTPEAAATPEATPMPEAIATPAATPMPVAAPVEQPLAAPRPARPALGWDVEAAMTSQGIFDGGVHVFSDDSWISGAEVRARKSVAPGASRVRLSPELAYGVAHTGRAYPGSADTELWVQRASAGARASMGFEGLPEVRPVLRAGATGLWGTALAHSTYRDHREEAYGFGAYASAGLELDIGKNLALRPQHDLLFGVELGHLYTSGLSFGRMGMLDVNGAFVSAQLAARF